MKVYIRSRRGGAGRDGNPALSCQPDGSVQANRFGHAKLWEEWDIEVLEGTEKTIALKSWTGKYLAGTPDGDAKMLSDSIGDWEKWKVVDQGYGFCALQSCHGKFLVCDDFFDTGKIVRADRDHANKWEHWAIVDHPDAMTNPGHTARQAVGGTLIGLGAIATIGALAVPVLGFGVAGVAAGSVAAGIQSAVYGGATTGLFSILQSAGATLAWVPIAAGGAAATRTGAAIVQH